MARLSFHPWGPTTTGRQSTLQPGSKARASGWRAADSFLRVRKSIRSVNDFGNFRVGMRPSLAPFRVSVGAVSSVFAPGVGAVSGVSALGDSIFAVGSAGFGRTGSAVFGLDDDFQTLGRPMSEKFRTQTYRDCRRMSTGVLLHLDDVGIWWRPRQDSNLRPTV